MVTSAYFVLNRQTAFLLFACFAFICTAFVPPVSADSQQPRLVIIIDDMGDNLAQGIAAINLPGPLAYAILPHTPKSKVLAEMANSQGKDVMVHVPMDNTHKLALGPGGLTDSLSKAVFLKTLRDGLKAVPYAVGFNNHMGSLLTQKNPQMQWAMQVAKKQQMFFIDSLTTSDTVAWKAARQADIPWLIRDIFLDHEQTPEFVERQFNAGVALARERGFAVLIGHPYPVTINFLQEALPRLGELGIQLVAPSGFLLQMQDSQDLERARQHFCEAEECQVKGYGQ
ncbi:divergent polysaccharide deacetylase family protein [Aliamphritea hakodatensis]|uniref:divergent polysaccharide deacetylase family protein n=1 Tax=Aliamphritea hakodatensis TaxID=2895352 RepID=UPI0022FD7DAB|nr:divergent polysaccharide deacetylase family protein [Aliamphritea hakodatensis]